MTGGSATIKTLFLVPEVDNDGQPFTREDWRWLDQQLRPFGGWSVRPGVQGAWRSEARRRWMWDVSREVTVSLASWRDLPGWLRVVRRVGARFGQDALYCEVAGIPEIIPTA